jgi:hypothetical protein
MIKKVIAFLENLDSDELDRLKPVHLRRFSELSFHWHKLAETRLKARSQETACFRGRSE